MTVDESAKIDFMTVDEATGVFWLTMVEHRPWRQIDDSFRELQDKTNFYIGATQDPSFAGQIPEAAGKKLGIRIMCAESPTPTALHILGLTRAGCEHFGLEFSVRIVDSFAEVPIATGKISDVPRAPAKPQPAKNPAKKPWWPF